MSPCSRYLRGSVAYCVDRALDLAIERYRSPRLRMQPWASCSHAYASVTEQYRSVPARQRRCPAAGKTTVGRASHWPCVTDSSGISAYRDYGLMVDWHMNTPTPAAFQLKDMGRHFFVQKMNT